MNDNTPVELNDALEQQQLFLENGVIVPEAVVLSPSVLSSMLTEEHLFLEFQTATI